MNIGLDNRHGSELDDLQRGEIHINKMDAVCSTEGHGSPLNPDSDIC